MEILQARLRLARGVGLLLMLALSVAGFMLLINILADPVSTAPADPLAERPTEGDSLQLPSSSSLFPIAIAAVAIVIAIVTLVSITRSNPASARSIEPGDGSPRPGRGRVPPLAIGLVLALLIAGAGLYLAFAESSPLLQAGADQQPGTIDGNTDGHRMDRNWIAPIGVVILAAFFFSVVLIGFLKPRLLFVTLGTWLALSLSFGFFTSSSLAGLTLFTPAISVPVSGAFASQVEQHRTIDLPKDERTPGQERAQNGDGSTPGDLNETDSSMDEVSSNVGEDIDDGQAGQSADASEGVLIHKLQSSPDPAERADAAEGLADYHSDESLGALSLAGLADPSLRVREAALDSIIEWSFEDLIEILNNHPNDTIRQAAAAALGRLNDPRAVEPLATALLTDEAADVRQESATALRKLGDADAVSSLIQALLQDEDSSVRAEAASALGALEDERAVQALLETLQDDASALAREAGATALGRIRGSNALAELDAARLDDLSANVRREAGTALRSYRVNELIDALHNAPEADDRAVAARLLGEGRNPTAIPELILALSDPEEIVREATLLALSQFGNVQTLENGNALLSHGGGDYMIPGTTTRQSSGLPHVPVFRFKNQASLDFLRTAVGDVYTGDGWLDANTKALRYATLAPIEQIDASGSPLTRISSMRGYTVYYQAVAGEVYLPGGILPIGYIPRTANLDGIYRPGSSTFLPRERRSYATVNVTPAVYEDSVLQPAVPEQGLSIVLPDSVPNRVRDLAARIAAGHTSAYAKAKAIERYLATTYTYRLADEDTVPIPRGHDPVDWFLFESREGTCGQFSSAFVVLAQSIGLPARVVSGFAINTTTDEQIVFADQAHQRAEIAFDGLGWIPFEPTASGQGPPDRASQYLASGESSPRSEQAELQRLAEQLSSDDPEKAQDAQRALEEQGASVQTLENGSRVVGLGGFTLATPPGTTADQSDGLLQFPVFTVTGAQETGYLPTATGDIYTGGGWRQLDPVTLSYSRSESVPDLVRDSFEDGREPWSNLPESRIEPILLAPDERDFDNDTSIRLRVAPIDGSGRIPAGVVPVSRHLNHIRLDGSYRPFSGTFEMDEPVLGYEWWSILPRPSERDLNRARSVGDPTYTQLPDDLDPRIHALAERITSGHRTPYAKARAIERYLKNNYKYVLGKDSTKPRRPAGFDAVEWFLFETREGTCGQFSSAFTVLARSAGLAARVVSGWMITATPNTQTVYSDQGHQWAEVAFEGIGWITFEATASGGAPTRVQSDGPPERAFEIVIETGPTVSGTVTNITSWPREIERGRPFIVGGTVRTDRGRFVSDMEVEIFINEVKAFGGLKVGSGTVKNGRYTIEVEIPPSLERGNYQLIAHAIENENYYESWSDPDIAVISQSGLVFSGPQEVNVGTEAVFRGRVTEDSGRGVPGIPVSIIIDGRSLSQRTTGDDGNFSFSNTFLQTGNHWAEVRFNDTDFLKANSARINLEVVMPTVLSLDVEPRVLVGSTFNIGGMLLDSRNQPLGGRHVAISIDGGEPIWTTAGADGRFQAEYTFEASGESTIEAAFTENRPLLGSRAAATIGVLNESVLTFAGPIEVLTGETATFFGQVHSPTLEVLEPLDIEILDGEGTGILTIATGPDGTFSYESPPITETGPRTLTARLAEQHSLTSSAASATYSVLHGTILEVDGPVIAIVGEEIVMTGSLRRSDGQPITEAPVQIGSEAALTGDDGAFSYAIALPSSLEGSAVEELLGVPYGFAGSEHLASAEGSHYIVVGIPRLTVERLAPVARGDVAEIRGAAFAGTRPMPNAPVSLTSALQDTTGPTGEFLISYPVPPDSPLGSHTLIASLDGLGVNIPITLDIRSSTHVVATPLDDIRPGRVAKVQAALYDDSGAGIPNAPLRTSTGLSLTTDEFGIALFEVAVPDSENLRSLPITFTYSGSDANMPLNYFLALPVTPSSFNWLLFVGFPLLLLALAGLGFSAYRLRLAGVPITVLDPRRPLPSWGTQVVTVPAPVLSERDSDDADQPREPVETRMTIELGGSAAETPGVYGISEEIVIIGRLYGNGDAPLTGMTIKLTVADREPIELVTDDNGEFHHLLMVDEFGEFALFASFMGTPDYLWSEAYASFRIVDFREEMVRLFGEFVDWASHLEPDISGQSPREIEDILVTAGIPVNQRALDEVITRFEEADYSEHEILRRHYEAMYKAWRIVVGD